MKDDKSTGDISARIKSALSYRVIVAEAQYEALRFALKHKDDVSEIRQELSRSQAILANPNLSAAMSRKTGPRIYQDSYIAKLEEILELIHNFEADP